MTTDTTGTALRVTPESSGFGPVLAEMANTLVTEMTYDERREAEVRQAWEALQQGIVELNLPKLDPNDPCLPALMFFTSVGCQDYPAYTRQHDVLLVWRKRTNELRLVAQPGNSSRPRLRRPVEYIADGFLLVPDARWTPIKFRDADVYIRRGLLGENNYLISRRAGADYLDLCSANPGAALKGQRGWYNYRETRKEIAEWSDTIKAALKEYTSAHWREEHRIKEELRDSGVSSLWRDKWVGAVNDAFSNAGHDQALILCDCGHVEVEGDHHETNGGSTFCNGCTDDHREIDGEWYHADDCYYWESDDDYHTEAEPEDSDDDDDSSSLIRSWGSSTDSLCHDRSFTSSTMGDFIMGVELEVESSSGYMQDAAEDTFNYFEDARRDYVTLKEDGSLSSYGFEIVTAARKLQDHLELFSDWKPHRSLSAWNPGTCGVHVHIDSRAFSGMTLGKFLMFINADCNQTLIKSIAGRHPNTDSKAQSYCAKLGQSVLETPSKALKADHVDRYRMVNLCNLSYQEQTRLKTPSVYRNSKGDYSTVELRIFKASLRKERLLSQIEFTHAAVMFCRVSSWADLNQAGFMKWLKGAAGAYKNLAHWYGINVPKANTKTTAVAVASTDETV